MHNIKYDTMVPMKLLRFKKTIDRTESGNEISELSFAITNDYPDTVNEQKKHILIGKKWGNNIYSLDAMDINSADISVLNRIKYKTIIALARLNSNTYSKENIDKAANIAMGFLAGEETHSDKNLLSYIIAHDTIGYGPIGIILDNADNIEEVLVNSPDTNIIVFHHKYGYCKTNMRFNGERQFRFIINKLIESIGRELNSEFPIIDANIFNGSRIHAQLSPYATNGALASIRLNQNLKFDLRRIIETNTASCDLIAYIWLALECGMNIVISGAPASGKTSLLVGLACLLPRYHRIVSIEENMNEIRLGGSMINSVSLQGMTGNSKADTRSQVINSLRLRPDRIIIGEIRGAEANELFSGANIGVPFATTMHSSENGAVLVNKLISKPMSVQPQAISMLDISIFMKQDISTRRLQSITEYKWLMRGEITSETAETEKENGLTFKEILVAYNSELDFKELRHSKTIAKFSKSRLMSIANAINELKKRSQYLSEISSPENIHKNTEEFIAMYNNIED